MRSPFHTNKRPPAETEALHGWRSVGPRASIDRSNAADTVQRGCMAEKGYLLVPEDQAAAKQAELAAIAEEKRRLEAGVAAPLPKPRKPMAKPVTPPA